MRVVGTIVSRLCAVLTQSEMRRVGRLPRVRGRMAMLRRVALIATGTLLLGMSGLAAQDYTLPPLSGEIKLADGFVPDPHTTEVEAGGPIALTANLAQGCVGFVSNAPNLRVYYTAGSNPLVIRAESATDLVLLVNTPDGAWQCNDD